MKEVLTGVIENKDTSAVWFNDPEGLHARLHQQFGVVQDRLNTLTRRNDLDRQER